MKINTFRIDDLGKLAGSLLIQQDFKRVERAENARTNASHEVGVTFKSNKPRRAVGREAVSVRELHSQEVAPPQSISVSLTRWRPK